MAHDFVSAERLRRLQPMASLDPATLSLVAPHCRIEHVARNQDPFRLRDWHGQVLYLLSGELRLDYPDGSSGVLVGGVDEALLPLAAERAKPVAGKTITDVDLLCVEEKTLDVAITWEQVATPGGDHQRSRDWQVSTTTFALRELTQGLFAALPAAHIEALLERFEEIRVRRGQVIIREGDIGDYYYLIESGRCLVTRFQSGVPTTVAELGPGAAFGEEALVAEALRNATVSMETDGVLLRLAKSDFAALLREPMLKHLDPEAARRKIDDATAVWLDVRLPVEWRRDGLPGAVNLPLNELRQDYRKLDAGREYIAYCQTGRRSSVAAFLLGQRGLRVYLLDGGLSRWQQTEKGSPS